MNWIAEEIRSYIGRDRSESIAHYGRSKLDGAPGRGSGRYPLGSGKDPHQHNGDFITRVKDLRKQGLTEKEIAKAMGFDNTTRFRVEYSRAVNDQRAARIQSIRAALADGKTQAEISREMNIPESTIRSLLNEESEARTTKAQATADFLRQQVNEKGMIDVGTGVERELNISREMMNQALAILEEEGYDTFGGRVPQATNPGKDTTIKVLCPPGTEHKDIYDYENIHTINDYRLRVDDDGSEHFDKGFEYPASMDSSRLLVRMRDDPIDSQGHTSVEMDGTIEIRRGVKDLDLGESHYAQVRILVDGDKYLKGMAFYSDDMPDGVDVIFNTNKTDPSKALKKIKDDPDNPFGALLKEEGGQYHYIDDDGERKLGLINKTREEGDWGEWADTLPSQFLSKQSMTLIHKQLNLSYADKMAEFEEICALTNPTVKKALLEEFANECDSSAVHLQAAALPRQQYQVILPVATMKDNEVYAPNFRDGETVALIRYPHGGTFEIPILTVNNKQADAVNMLGKTPADAIGINSNVAERLSGADFDGDTVMVIPCNTPGKVSITSTPKLKGLEGFDNKLEYGYTDSNSEIVNKKIKHKDGTVTYEDVEVTHYYRGDHEFTPMSKANVQREMGSISNLITDMTLKGASEDEICRAVRHSMVVIDAEKHKLDYKQSEIDNGIAQLKRKYQSHTDENGNEHLGASTLISSAKSQTQVLKRRGTPKINEQGKDWYDPSKPEGALIYKEVVEEYTDKSGKKKVRMQDSTKMAETTDARSLSSGTPQEEAYAEYANRMKSMANSARKEMLKTGKIEYSSSARETYREEVDSIMAQLNMALKNAPRERQAQLTAASVVKAKQKANPDMTTKERKKIAQQALSKARAEYNARRQPIKITERGWQAIQEGAFSESTLKDILRFADSDQVKSYATPKTRATLTDAKRSRIRAMKASGFTTSEIADALGVSTSTISRCINGKE